MGARIVGQYLYATGSTGLRIYDLVNRELPLLVGAFPMETFSNEDVSVSAFRKLVFISNDNAGNGVAGGLWVIDVANPALPTLRGFLSYGLDSVGHTFTCINDCLRYGYVSGDGTGKIMVVDVLPANPIKVGYVSTAAGSGAGNAWKLVHDVYQETSTTAWVLGTRGIEKLNVSNPLSPTRLNGTSTAQNDAHNQFIFHNALRGSGSTLLVTEEDWINASCKIQSDLGARPEGSFQTWQINASTLTALDQWTTELSYTRPGLAIDGNAPAAAFCSAHWFDRNASDIVAIGWYQQGVRFLDVSNPLDIKQVGYYLPPWELGGMGVSMVLYAPGRPDIAYAMSLTSGLVVLKLANAGAGASTVTAPIPAEWLRPVSGINYDNVVPDPQFGLACARLRAR